MRQLVEESRRLLRLRTISRDGNEELANYLASLMTSRGLKATLQQVSHSLPDVSRRQFNVIGVLGDPLVDRKTRKGLLLAFPLDTAPPGILESWTETQGDPYAGVLSDGKLYGLGASSEKLGILCALRALERFREKKLKMPVYIVGLCGHELNLLGARYLIKSLALNPRYSLIAAPTRMIPVYTTKAQATCKIMLAYQVVERDAKGFNRRVDLHSFGRVAHSAYPELGNNALTQLLSFLQLAQQNGFDLRFTTFNGGDASNTVPDRAKAEFYLNAQQFEDFKRFFRETVKLQSKERAFRVELGGLGDTGIRFMPDAVFKSVVAVMDELRTLSEKLRAHHHEGFDPDHSTLCLTGLRHLPSGIEMTVDFRLTPGVEVSTIEKDIQEAIRRVAQISPSMNMTASKDGMVNPLGMTLDRDFVRLVHSALEKRGSKVSFGTSPLVAEASPFYDAGFEALMMGSGDPKRVHGPNEFLEVESLEAAYRFYDQLIEEVCL
jgi:acetylornithine deacetylase/succinyl-diaminopimelate desuccinylase-like protein